MTDTTILTCENVSLSFGKIKALTDVEFGVQRGELLSIIGPNGAGKTSIINTITGYYTPTEGEVLFKGKRVSGLPPHKVCAAGIARTFQHTELFSGLTVLENFLAARHLFLKTNIFLDCLYWGPTQKKEIAEREVAEEITSFLELEAIRKRPVGELPYGLRKRVELGRAIALEPEIIFLDEPTAGMNVQEKEDMVRFVLDINKNKGTTIVLVEHDMDIVMDISDRIIVFDFGKKIADGAPDSIKQNEKVVSAYLGAEQD